MNASSPANLATLGAAPEHDTRRSSVVTVAIVLVMAFAVSGILWPTLQSLNIEWRNIDNLTYTHGYLVVAVSVWLILRAYRLPRAAHTPEWRLLSALLALSLCWLVALRAGIELIHQVLWPPIILLTICTAIGARNGARFWFPVAFLYFAIPVWTVGNEILQNVTVVAVSWLLRLSAVPAYVAGNIVHIPAGVFEIAGGCSGLHFMIVALTIAALFGEIHHDSLKARVQLLVLAGVLAALTNWLRVYIIIVAGHLTDMQHYLVRVSHYYFGWAVFAVTMIAFFFLANRIPARAQSGDSVHDRRGAGADSRPESTRRWSMGVVCALAALSVGPAWNILAPVAPAAVAGGKLLLPDATGIWAGPFDTAGDWQPSYLGSDRSERGDYRGQSHSMTAFIAEYEYQRQGKELIAAANSITSGLDGDVSGQKISGPGGPIGRLHIAHSRGRESLLLYRYQIGSQRLANGFAAQLRYGSASLFAATVSRVIAVHALCSPDCEAASAAAQQLLELLDSNHNVATDSH